MITRFTQQISGNNKKITDCAFIVTHDAVFSCVAGQNLDGRIYAVAECENKPRFVVQALSEETALIRLNQKLKGIIIFL